MRKIGKNSLRYATGSALVLTSSHEGVTDRRSGPLRDTFRRLLVVFPQDVKACSLSALRDTFPMVPNGGVDYPAKGLERGVPEPVCRESFR